MAKYAQGNYTPKNPDKYVGKGIPKYRSGWELTFMIFCDTNKSVLKWASESLAIPYKNPVTGKNSNYIPDFFVLYENRLGRKIAEIVEIKPKKQSLLESKVANAKNTAVIAVNYAKWQAAGEYCKRNGLIFRVITEDDLFRNGKA